MAPSHGIDDKGSIVGITDKPGVGRRTAGSVAWLMASRLMARGIDFAALIVLARTLSPQDFGLISVAMTLIFIVEAVSELPIVQSLVRLDQISRSHLDTAFTIGLIRGGLLATVIVLAAFPFSWAYADARLVPLILFLALAPITRGLQSPAMVQYARRIDFRRDLIIEIVSKVCGFLVATGLAVTTHSYWAIAAGTVATPLIALLQSYAFAPFKPRISLSQWRSFAGFLGWASLAQALGALSWQSDKLILGRFISKADLGHFSLAADLSSVPEQVLVAPAMRPLMAGFVTMKESRDRIARAYQRISLTLLTIAAPGMVGLSLVADQLVPVVLGDHWVSSIPMLRWLSLAPVFVVWVSPLDPMAMAMDRTSIFLRQRVIEICIKIPLLLALIWSYGVMGAVIGRVVTNAIMMIVTMGFVRSLTGLSLRRQLAGPWRIALAIAAMATAILLLPDTVRKSLSLLGVITTVGVGGLSYVTMLLATWIVVGRPEGMESMVMAHFKQIGSRFGLVGGQTSAPVGSDDAR
jgi:O-antigen/teichoic acid export membrane protein